ncbi:MAG: hypothetical protein RMJ19_02555, partial [Gemmatales bacterium]|nr:hypothetical protein [Gemmatales bacterium]MDW8174529.1 hypothetical protein [Gemmatales bacterium]
MTRAVMEQRAFGWNNGTVRVLGIQLQNRIYVDQKGQSYLVAQIQSSNNPALLAGDVIFAADGMLLAPGQDLTVILNRPGATDPALLLVLRLGEFTVVPAFTTIVRYQPQEINQRRVVDAAEKVYLDLQVSQGI